MTWKDTVLARRSRRRRRHGFTDLALAKGILLFAIASLLAGLVYFFASAQPPTATTKSAVVPPQPEWAGPEFAAPRK